MYRPKGFTLESQELTLIYVDVHLCLICVYFFNKIVEMLIILHIIFMVHSFDNIYFFIRNIYIKPYFFQLCLSDSLGLPWVRNFEEFIVETC